MVKFRCVIVLWVLLILAASAVRAEVPVVLVLGDSLSAAHNIPRQAGWVSLLQARLSDPPRARVVNASISGETTAGGLSRLPVLLSEHQPAVVVIELGANDGLRGLPMAQIRDNLEQLVVLAQTAGARVLLLGIELPINFGARYRGQLRSIYADLAAQRETALVPFLLEGVALDPQLIQDDGLHPTAAAQPRILANVWPALMPLLGAAR